MTEILNSLLEMLLKTYEHFLVKLSLQMRWLESNNMNFPILRGRPTKSCEFLGTKVYKCLVNGLSVIKVTFCSDSFNNETHC